MGGSNAEDISIPSVMISSTDGTRLKSRLLNNQTINVSLSLETLASAGRTVSPGIFYINDVVVRDNDGTSEVIIAAGVSSHRDDTNLMMQQPHGIRFLLILMVLLILINQWI
jgi:hypothetical protein